MSYLTKLMRSAESPASAYLQFLTEKDRDTYVAFAFVEDEDDIYFYQHVLLEQPNICYFGCGGKSGVIAAFERLELDNRAAGNLFIVDRDSEQQPYIHGESVLRTTLYSWESHLCDPSIVRTCVQRRANPNLSRQQAVVVGELWEATLEAFREEFALHSALLRYRSETSRKLGLRHLRFSAGAIPVEGRLIPGANLHTELVAKETEGDFSEATTGLIREAELSFSNVDIRDFARGKTLFELLRSFIVSVAHYLEFAVREQLNSPKHILATVPWNYPEFDYIRTYTATRLGTAG
jgi:hypothetical protein